MVTALGGFIAELDEKLQVNDARVFIPVRNAELTARSLRVKIQHAPLNTPEGRVSAVIEGAGGSLARSVYPDNEALWDQFKVPKIPPKNGEGTVKDAPFKPGACLPEIERCKRGTEAKPIPIDRPVKSEGFIVHLSLALAGFSPGMKIRGVVALSDE